MMDRDGERSDGAVCCDPVWRHGLYRPSWCSRLTVMCTRYEVATKLVEWWLLRALGGLCIAECGAESLRSHRFLYLIMVSFVRLGSMRPLTPLHILTVSIQAVPGM
jgi:hypothetical protein